MSHTPFKGIVNLFISYKEAVMTGSKPLIGFVLALVLALLFGSLYFPESFLMSLADTSMIYTIIRVVIASLLIVLLLTKPPRSYYVRMIIGVWSAILATLSVGMLLSYNLQLFDAVIFMEVAIIFALEALEVRTIRIKEKYLPPRKITVRSV